MKIKITSLAFILFIGGTLFSFAQVGDCKVLMEGIQNEYSGGCKKGLADGNGIAKGRFLYEGNFKKGLPHGKGTLKYSSDEYYIGEWKNGLQDGKGKLYYKVKGVDSLKVGVWENGNYIGKSAITPYVVKYKSGVDRYSFIRLNDGNSANTNRVKIKFVQNGGNNATISDIMLQGDSGNRINTTNADGFENISFPFTCKISYVTPNKMNSQKYTAIFEFVIFKQGDWELILNN